MNVKFEYLYRDSGNNKRHGWAILENRKRLRIESIRQRILRLVGDERSFTPSSVGLPDLFFEEFPYDPELDCDQHEFVDIAATDLPADYLPFRDVSALLDRLESS